MKSLRLNAIGVALAIVGASAAFSADPTSGMTPGERGGYYQGIGLGIGGSYGPSQFMIEESKKQDAARTNLLNSIAKRQSDRNRAALEGVDERVVRFLRERIQNGSADAAYDLGVRYQKGQGVEANSKEARNLFLLAASRGNEDAARWLSTNSALTNVPLSAQRTGDTAPPRQ